MLVVATKIVLTVSVQHLKWEGVVLFGQRVSRVLQWFPGLAERFGVPGPTGVPGFCTGVRGSGSNKGVPALGLTIEERRR